MGANYRLATHGDPLERRAWGSFLANEFPSYETYWRQFVVPLTKRPEPGGFRPKAELGDMGKTDHHVCLAQLHYTVLGHLDVAHDLRQRTPVDPVDFVHAMVRLSAASDVAYEFLERLAHPGVYDPWSEDDGETARRSWRRGHPDLHEIHEYRNRLLHGRLFMGLIVLGTKGYWFPRVGQPIRLDWRDATEQFDPARLSGGFDTANNVLDDSWRRVVTYIEANWKAALA